MSDSFAADVDQVPGCEHPNGFIIHSDEVRRKTREASIDQYVRCVLLFNAKEDIDCRVARCNDQRVEAARQQVIDLNLLKSRIFVGGAND
jgi:hypothetical protein